MKNTIKMSLVAALAVAGLSTTASAGSLEEAIKGVNISGKMEVEYDRTESNTTGATRKTTGNSWDLDWDVTAKIPVNDNVTAVFGMEGDTTTDVNSQNINSQEGKDNLQVTKVYFQYANGPVTALVGKQGMAGAPWFDDERANGVVALYNAGVATLAAAHFTGSNASANLNTTNALSGATATSALTTLPLTNADINAVAVIGSMGPVNAQLWYASLAGLGDTAPTVATARQVDADSVALIADVNLDVVNLTVKYAEANYDLQSTTGYETLNDDAEMLQVIVSGDVAGANLYAGYGATDSKQGGAGLDLTSDTDSTLDFGSEQLSIDDLDNAEAFIIGGSMPFGNLTVGASYVWGDYTDYLNTDKTKTTGYNADLNEFLVELDYKMSKNFTIGAHYSDAEIESQTAATTKVTTDSKDMAVSLEYKF